MAIPIESVERATFVIDQAQRSIRARDETIKENEARINELGAALLWLRNHYDVGKRGGEHRAKVLKVIDRILLGPDKVNTWLSLDAYAVFREKWLGDDKGEARDK